MSKYKDRYDPLNPTKGYESGVVWGYARRSKQERAVDSESGSITGQRERMLKFYETFIKPRFPGHTYDPESVFVDEGVSGNKPIYNRKAGNRLCQAVNPGDLILVAAWDRGFRNLLDFLQSVTRWREARVLVYSANMPVDIRDDMQFGIVTMMAAMAQQERSLACRRAYDHKTQLIQKMKPIARISVPLGYKIVGKDHLQHVVPCQHERKLGELVVQLKDEQGVPLDKISTMLWLRHNLAKTPEERAGVTLRGHRIGFWSTHSLYRKCKAGWPFYRGTNYNEHLAAMQERMKIAYETEGYRALKEAMYTHKEGYAIPTVESLLLGES